MTITKQKVLWAFCNYLTIEKKVQKGEITSHEASHPGLESRIQIWISDISVPLSKQKPVTFGL